MVSCFNLEQNQIDEFVGLNPGRNEEIETEKVMERFVYSAIINVINQFHFF